MLKKSAIIFIIFIQFALYGQESIHNFSIEDQYIKAVNLYHEKEYLPAKYIFEQIKGKVNDESLTADVYYYLASIAVRTEAINAEELLNYFTEHFPTHPKRNLAYFDTADYYFSKGNLEKGEKLINKVDPGDLSKDEYEKYNFYMAYSYLEKKDWKKAEQLFEKLLDSKVYGKQAKYYYAYIAYQQNDFAKAQKYFEQISDEKQYNKKLAYYQADMYFKLGRFKDAIQEAMKIYHQSHGKQHSELAKIIGESYFNLHEYEKALPYLNAYKGKDGKWNNTDFYQLGYAYYQTGKYDQAIQFFNKIISGNDAITQNAYYHLADSYIKTGQKIKALNAFKKVSEMEFDKNMQEDAFYNYVKLGYELGNPFENSSKVIREFLKKYPQSPYKTELEDLLVNSYLTSNNFEAAIKILEKNKQTQSKTYQKAAYYRGLELFNEGNYSQAKQMFDKVLQAGFDPKIRQLSKFWKAEADYRLGNYEKSLQGFEDFAGTNQYKYSKEGKIVNYNFGYTYFKLKNYKKAAQYFDKFIQTQPDKKLLKDSYLRLGDSYFASKKYWPAMEAYNKAILLKGPDADYAAFQKAISYGFVGKINKKIANLKQFITDFPHSKYLPEAYYQLGSSYTNQDQNKKALQIFEKLINKFPQSKFISLALLKEGNIYYNANQNKKAIEKYKKIVTDYPNTPIAHQAVEQIKNIYIEEGKGDEYAAWVKNIPWISISDTELDNSIFESAQEKYMSQSPDAIQSLEKYLQEFPLGLHHLEAHKYLARLYEKKGKKGKMALHYEYIASQPQNNYTLEALRELSELYLKQKKWKKVLPYLERLELLSQSPEDLIFAQSNLMKGNYQTKNYEEAVEYAQKVLSNPKSSQQMKNDAKIILARAALKTGDKEKAKLFYTELSKKGSGEIAAESLYYVAKFLNDEGKYKLSNQTIAQLTKKYAGYKYWAAKALVLMAKNTYAKGDAFNATYILESVIKNFKQYPEIVQEAQTLLQEIKNKEAKKNSSVND